MIFCAAYQLRRNGQRLPPDEVQRTVRHGWLWYGQKMPNGMPVPSARLFLPGEPYPQLLEHVRSVAVTNGGLLLHGQEYASPSEMQVIWQAWWCVPAPEPAGVRRPDSATPFDRQARARR